METDWLILSVTGVSALVLVLFLIRQNRKDEKTYEKDLNNTEDSDTEDSELNDDNGPY